MISQSFSGRARQAWTIAKIELRRVFLARRSLWVYGLALLPSVIFFGHGLDVKLTNDRLTRRSGTPRRPYPISRSPAELPLLSKNDNPSRTRKIFLAY